MAKRLAKILAVINGLLLMAVIYFIQTNDNRMVVLFSKLLLATFLVFLFVSLIFRVLETNQRVWRLIAITGGFALAYTIYFGIGEIALQTTHRDITAGLGELEFLKALIIGGLVLTGMSGLLCGLVGTKGGSHD